MAWRTVGLVTVCRVDPVVAGVGVEVAERAARELRIGSVRSR